MACDEGDYDLAWDMPRGAADDVLWEVFGLDELEEAWPDRDDYWLDDENDE